MIIEFPMEKKNPDAFVFKTILMIQISNYVPLENSIEMKRRGGEGRGGGNRKERRIIF